MPTKNGETSEKREKQTTEQTGTKVVATEAIKTAKAKQTPKTEDTADTAKKLKPGDEGYKVDQKHPPHNFEKGNLESRKGGLASVEARRKRKELREIIRVMLDMEVNDSSKESLKAMGFKDPDDFTVQTAIVAIQALKAMRGDTKSAQFLLEYGGLDPKMQLEREKFDYIKAKDAPMVLEEDNENDVVVYLPELEKEGDDGDNN